ANALFALTLLAAVTTTIERPDKRRRREKLWFHGTDSTETISVIGLSEHEMQRYTATDDIEPGLYVSPKKSIASAYADFKTKVRLDNQEIPVGSYPVVLAAQDKIIGRFLISPAYPVEGEKF